MEAYRGSPFRCVPRPDVSPSRCLYPHPDVSTIKEERGNLISTVYISSSPLCCVCVSRASSKPRDLVKISIRFTGNFKEGAKGVRTGRDGGGGGGGGGTHRHSPHISWGHIGVGTQWAGTHRHSPHISWGHIGMWTHRGGDTMGWGHIGVGTQWAGDTSTFPTHQLGTHRDGAIKWDGDTSTCSQLVCLFHCLTSS